MMLLIANIIQLALMTEECVSV